MRGGRNARNQETHQMMVTGRPGQPLLCPCMCDRAHACAHAHVPTHVRQGVGLGDVGRQIHGMRLASQPLPCLCTAMRNLNLDTQSSTLFFLTRTNESTSDCRAWQLLHTTSTTCRNPDLLTSTPTSSRLEAISTPGRPSIMSCPAGTRLCFTMPWTLPMVPRHESIRPGAGGRGCRNKFIRTAHLHGEK